MHESWSSILNNELNSAEHVALQETIAEKRKTNTIYPAEPDVFAAFSTPFEDVRVVIVGQDPYHGEGQAHGYSFSVPNGVRVPPSLVNIIKESGNQTMNGNLTTWAAQGVLLLNTVLTVQAGRPMSHRNIGWERFTHCVINELMTRKKHLVFLLWGRAAQRQLCNQPLGQYHLILKAAHPSPLGAHYNAPIPFTKCGHFEKANQYLSENGYAKIHWRLS